uniref:PiggyBac transposable element-derived protein domain-containing protein n=1 Tax=Phytophthora ramorum TaxID=164328 RepID=H3GEE4_PHYRM
MDISQLLNNDSDGADWEFEASEAEEADESPEDEADDGGGAAAESDGEEAPPVSTSPSAQRRTGNAYVDHLIQASGLHIKDRGELGLFSLFFTREFRTSLQTWTNEMLKTKGRFEATEFEIDAYIGLEIAMSFNPVTEIKELWSQKLFMSQSDFASTMARNRFESIRARFQIHAPESVPVERRELDPLWHSRRLMAQIQEKFATIAVPVGAVSLDDNTVRTKARSLAKTFLSSKPDKYGVRFYAVVGWESLHAYSVWDNGSGNRTRTTPAERYVGVFPALRTPLFRTLDRGDIPISRKDPSVLWVAMCGHLTKQYPAQDGHRLLVCDNFYTRHNLAKTLMAFTDGEMRMLGTVRISLQGKWNAAALETAKARVDAAERGSWELVAAVDVAPGWEKLQEKHKRAQKKLPPHLQTEYVASMTVAAGAGYIVFRDKLTVIFYTNDLAGTPSQRVLPGNSPEAIWLCRGLAPLRRWTADRVMHRQTFRVPSMVVAYNLFMNGVDRVGQLRSTNPIRRKEKRLSMSILTWALDLALINAFTLLKKVAGEDATRVTLRDFKQRVAEKLTAVQRVRVEKQRRRQPVPNEPIADVVGADDSSHAITPNSTQHSAVIELPQRPLHVAG